MSEHEHRVYYSLVKTTLFCDLPPMLILFCIGVNITIIMTLVIMTGLKTIYLSIVCVLLTVIGLYVLRSRIKHDPKYAELIKKRMMYDKKFFFKKDITYWR